ncbi:triokinase/FMN cyclase-like [Liolophura sinensis]|uniref:triokinase/FMN cyclase-like n=1 Tax=Liolophura sinensis TaxID=3198878 RepID=UPI0031584BB9
MNGMSDMRKRLLNTVESCVDDSLSGLVSVNPGLRLLRGHSRVIVRSDILEVIRAGKVTILTGGGSGHEPSRSGYVGPGMASAAVSGAIFTSPPPGDILAALRAIGRGNKAGVLVTFNNYTGDRLTFGQAMERAQKEGIKLDVYINSDDCAVQTSDKTAGRRGLVGGILALKIAGAMAEEGKSLPEIKEVLNFVFKNMGTIGLCLIPGSVPGSGPMFQLEDDEMELGLGLHGESGVMTMKIMPAREQRIHIYAGISHIEKIQNSDHCVIFEVAHLIFESVKACCETLISVEDILNQLDTECGDGDCGHTFKVGATAILSELNTEEIPGLPIDCPYRLAHNLASLVEESMGGSTGALYGLFMTAASGALKTSVTPVAWCEALRCGTDSVMRHGGAKPGYRTMLDALCPAVEAFALGLETLPGIDAFEKAVLAAENGARCTAGMKAQAGRASYVAASSLEKPDPGATAVGVWMRAILQVLTASQALLTSPYLPEVVYGQF